MTTKQKAAYLMLSYMAVLGHKPDLAKQCALVAADEIMNNCYKVHKPFWLEVKNEIKKYEL